MIFSLITYIFYILKLNYLLGARHLKEFSDHPRALAHVLLHELRAYHADEAGVGPVGHRACAEGFACT